MRNCLEEITGRIEFAVEYTGKTAKDVRNRMDEVMASRGEGLVIKHPLSKYVLNGRNMDWIKPWKTWDSKCPPDFLLTAKRSHEDKGDVYLEPEDSFILKVKAAEIVPSGDDFISYQPFMGLSSHSPLDQYDMGFTMRFPRALSIRDDLSIADCMTATGFVRSSLLAEAVLNVSTEILESMRSEKKRKMESDAGVSQKKRKTVTKKAVMLPEYQGPRLRGMQVTSRLFSGLKFVVMSDPKSRTGDQDKKELMKLIHINGGTCAQIATKQQDLFIVYGGKVTPYDLQLLIDKGIHDVIKPEWVIDSVEKEALAPFAKKYFFHAKTDRVEANNYDDEADNGGDAVNSEVRSPSPTPEAKEQSPVLSVKEEQAEDDPALGDWFKVDEAKEEEQDMKYDSVTDADSDNVDVEEGDDDLEDWFTVTKATVEPSASTEQESSGASSFADVTMGENQEDMEYDQEHIFRHLCFYLDSPENAQKNGMAIKLKNEDDLNKSFAQLLAKIVENGGRVVDLSEPKLTHIIIDKRDNSRRLELMKRTAKSVLLAESSLFYLRY
ncbi:hypothetical protein H0H87_003528 [Tephrocybe sp. NHM501043]|nr:hypothetical protein H0H87_003528 [Tephrocybe sp. NHM501043]